jgi:hypothetical protein
VTEDNTQALVVIPPIEGEGDVLQQAQDCEIGGPETAEIAVELREGIKALIAEIDGAFRPHIKRAHELHAGLCTELRERTAVPKAALDVVTTKIGDYEIARKQAEEREQRKAAEQQAREAAARREAEAQAAAVYSPTQAEDIRQMPVEHFAEPVTTPATTAPRTKGVAVTLAYEAQLTDLAALVAFAHTHPAMMAVVLAPNQAGLDLLVKQQGFAIPGVKRVPKGPQVRSTRR